MTGNARASRRWWLPLSLVASLILVALVVGVVRWSRLGIDRFPVRGIDVSHHQGTIDWAKVATADVGFAFIKATEGRDHEDTRFTENWSAAGQAGLVRGAYHFFTFCTPGVAQVEHFLKIVPPVSGTLPPVADVEFAGNCKAWTSIEDIRTQLRIFLELVEKAWGRRPILYITRESARRIIGGHFDHYPIWIRSVFWRPPGDPAWLFWQYTDEADLPGIATPVDMNVFHGQPGEWAAFVR
jgi:lysozyme